MVDLRALEKLVEDGISIVSYKYNNMNSGRMIRNVRMEPDGRVSFKIPEESDLAVYLQDAKTFSISVVKVGTNVLTYQDLFERFDSYIYTIGTEFQRLSGRKLDENGLYYATNCVNAVIFCKMDEIVKAEGTWHIYGYVDKSQLLCDEPTLTDEVYRNTLRKRFSLQECMRCGTLYARDVSADYCVYCGGDIVPIPWQERERKRIG